MTVQASVVICTRDRAALLRAAQRPGIVQSRTEMRTCLGLRQLVADGQRS